jgi:hypothetical protein
MTPRQIELARHALGLDGRRKQSYRNRFWAGPGHGDFADWEAMVADGYAFVSAPAEGHRPDHAFWLTRKGAQLALRKGERLCPEDFPTALKE